MNPSVAAKLAPGMRLKSVVDTTQVVVVKAPDEPIDLRCGGHAMVGVTATADGAPPGLMDPRHSSGSRVGKRYGDEELGLELLCTTAGEGSLAVGDKPLAVRSPKPLPSSD